MCTKPTGGDFTFFVTFTDVLLMDVTAGDLPLFVSVWRFFSPRFFDVLLMDDTVSDLPLFVSVWRFFSPRFFTGEALL